MPLTHSPPLKLPYLCATCCGATPLALRPPYCCRQYSLSSLVCLGGFDNTRIEATWQGFTLELDKTVYPWGTLYELEAETVRGRSACSWQEGVRTDGQGEDMSEAGLGYKE